MNEHPSLLARIYRLKLLALGALMVLAGLLASLWADWLRGTYAIHLWVALAQALSDVLVVTGGFGIAVDFFTGRDKEAAETERIRTVMKQLVPDFTDALLTAFAVEPDDLARVATPELLDAIVTNALGLRLGDPQFAGEIYTDIRDQAIRAPERWHDVDVSVRLSTAGDARTKGADLLSVLVSWEYTVVPSHPVQRFACTSDPEEFRELISDIPATSTWFMTPRPGLNAADREAFELLSFSVDGEDRAIRHAGRKSGQTYSATIGEEQVRAGIPVRIRHTYRTLTDPSNHRLFLAISQPARNVTMEVDYSASDISRLSVTDLVPSSRRPYVSQLPAQATGKELTIEVPGWVQAGTGFTFVWTRDSEEPSSRQRRP